MRQVPYFRFCKNLAPIWALLHHHLLYRFLPHPMARYLSPLLLFLSALPLFSPVTTTAVESKIENFEHLTQPVVNTTLSLFEEDFITKNIPLPFGVEEVKDEEIEIGETVVKQEGREGVKIQTIKVTTYNNEEYAQEVVKEEVKPPVKKIIAQGTKIIWREVDTSTGPQKYWRKLRVWATSYDPYCPGCNGITATGLKAGYGVIAVDPKVIKLGTKVYVPGYGEAIAGDTGGAVKGNIIDLGFDNVKNGWWSSRWTDIYLLN
jgi:3D (Asp-Asp-Asp) domain-containing protein